jgi:hypothetical protein
VKAPEELRPDEVLEVQHASHPRSEEPHCHKHLAGLDAPLLRKLFSGTVLADAVKILIGDAAEGSVSEPQLGG